MDFPKWNVKPQKGTGAWKGTYGFEIPSGIGPYDSSYPTMWVQGPEDMSPSKAAYLRRVMDTFRLGELKQGYGERQRMMEGLDAGELAANEKQWGDWRSAELAKAHATGLVSNQTLNRQALGVQQEQLAAQQIRDRQKMRLAGGLEGYLKMLERVNTSGLLLEISACWAQSNICLRSGTPQMHFMCVVWRLFRVLLADEMCVRLIIVLYRGRELLGPSQYLGDEK